MSYHVLLQIDQFILLRGTLGCEALFFIAIRIEMGVGSIAALITSGPMMLLGFRLVARIILFVEMGFIGSRWLFVLFCLYRYPCPRSCRLWARSRI